MKELHIDQKDKEYVRNLFPELQQVRDRELADKACEAWVYAWRESGYERIEDVPYSTHVPGSPSNVEHTSAVTRICIELVKIMKDCDVDLDMDHVIVGSICHDLGKPFEWGAGERGVLRVEFGTGCFYPEGNPNVLRHPFYSVHIAKLVDLPREIIHIVGSHAAEGYHWRRTPEAMVVHFADNFYAQMIERHKFGPDFFKLDGREFNRLDVE